MLENLRICVGSMDDDDDDDDDDEQELIKHLGDEIVSEIEKYVAE